MQTESYVLVIEDDQDLREILTGYLETHGHRVVSLSDGAEALAYLDKGKHPVAIVCDVMMPGVLGTTIAEYLRASRTQRNIPIAFTTANPRAVPIGYRVWLKPYRLTDMLAFVEAAIQAT
ncbi:MAG: response regulator [Kofleriaceae bacterium]